MSEHSDHNIWPGVSYDDANAARSWLRDLGFEEGIVVPSEDGKHIHHSEMRWPEGGRVMVHSRGGADTTFDAAKGAAIIYVVTDQPEEVLARAERLGAKVIRPFETTDYGSTGFSITDPEGNSWSFGTYAG